MLALDLTERQAQSPQPRPRDVLRSPNKLATCGPLTLVIYAPAVALDYDSVNLASFQTSHLLRLRRLRIRRRALDYDSVNIPSFRMPHPLE